MSYVPVQQPTSKRSRELAKEIVRAVEEYREREPRTSDQEVQRAMMLARSRLGGSSNVIFLVLVGLAMLAGLLAFLLTSWGD
jgi:uncharacterized membrane protein